MLCRCLIPVVFLVINECLVLVINECLDEYLSECLVMSESFKLISFKRLSWLDLLYFMSELCGIWQKRRGLPKLNFRHLARPTSLVMYVHSWLKGLMVSVLGSVKSCFAGW